MSDKRDQFNRRKFLGSVAAGTSALGTVGIPTVSALTADFKKIENSKRVEQILKEFPTLELDHSEAEAQLVKIQDEEVQYTEIRTNLGILQYFENNSRVEEAVLNILEPNSQIIEDKKNKAQVLPDVYRDLPSNAYGGYFVGANGEAFIRTPTSNELDALNANVSFNVENEFVFGINKGFYVVNNNGDTHDHFHIIPDGDSTLSTSKNILTEYDSRSLRNAEVREVTIQKVELARGEWKVTPNSLSDCVTWCGCCIGGAGGCWRCAVICAGSVTGIGAIGCAICLVASCGAGGYCCGKCYDNCQSYV